MPEQIVSVWEFVKTDGVLGSLGHRAGVRAELPETGE